MRCKKKEAQMAPLTLYNILGNLFRNDLHKRLSIFYAHDAAEQQVFFFRWGWTYAHGNHAYCGACVVMVEKCVSSL